MSLIDLYVRDKSTGKIHKVGSVGTMVYGLIATALSIIRICKMEMVAMLTATMINLQDMNLCQKRFWNGRPSHDDAGRSD